MSDVKSIEIWRAWVWANAWAELFGLSATFLIGYGLFTIFDEPQTLVAALGFVVLMTSTGVAEGTLVGWFQWRVLRRKFPGISLRQWWIATLLGALTAWFFGSLPSTFMGMAADPSGQVSVEPPLILILLFASGMGLILGVVLAFPQWRVLRRVAQHSWLWLPANSLAWGIGMPVIFAGIDLAQRFGALMAVVVAMASTFFLAGAAVGAIHGVFLLRLIPSHGVAHDEV